MNLHVEVVILLLWELLATHRARAALLPAVCAAHVAVVGCVRGEGFAAVLALEGLLPRVLADVSAQDAGCRERLKGQGLERGEKELKEIYFHIYNPQILLEAMYPENKSSNSSHPQDSWRKNQNLPATRNQKPTAIARSYTDMAESMEFR